MSQKLWAHTDAGIRSGPSIGAAIPARPRKLHLCQNAAALFSETRYLGDHLQAPFPLLKVLSWIPLFRREKTLQKNGKKAVAVISQSSFFPRKKARTFVLTFEKLASIRDLPSLRMFFLRADLPLPHRNALTYPRKHRKGAHRRRHRSSCFRRQRTHTPLPSRKQRVSHPSSSLS